MDAGLTAAEVMRPLAALETVTPETTVNEAFTYVELSRPERVAAAHAEIQLDVAPNTFSTPLRTRH